MGHRLLESKFLNLSQITHETTSQRIFQLLKKYKWTIGSSIVIGSTAYYTWKILNSVPIRQILAIMVESEGKAELEVTSILRGGEGMRLLGACLLDIHSDLSGILDVQEKQAAARAPGNVTVQERLEAFKQLSICSFSRTLSAVYSLCILNVFIHVQVFELVKQRKQGSELHDDAQRRFLSVVQAFRSGESSALSVIARRVEASVRKFFDSHSVTMDCRQQDLHSILCTLRDGVNETAQIDSQEGDDCTWMTKLMLEIVKAKIKVLDASQWRRMPLRSSFSQETDVQLKQLFETVTEILESELFAEALSAAVNQAFQVLETEISVRGFVTQTSEACTGPEAQSEDASREKVPSAINQVSVPLVKLVPVVSNLFGHILSTRSSTRERDEFRSFSECIIQTQECSNLFTALSTG